MTNAINTTCTDIHATPYKDPLEKFIELRDSVKATAIYKDALRAAAIAALDNFYEIWETPERPETFYGHVLDCGPSEAFNVIVEWAEMQKMSVVMIIIEHGYNAHEAWMNYLASEEAANVEG